MAESDEDNTTDRNIQRLQNKLAALYGRAQSIFDSIKSINVNDPISIDNFLANSYTIDVIRKDFIEALEERNEAQTHGLSRERPVGTYNSLISFEQLYTHIKYKVNQLTTTNTRNIKNENDSRSSKTYKLPRLELCPFNGENESWPIFYETFRTAIHENEDLTDGEKIQYLVGKLSGKALVVCQGILPTAENYNVIWNALVNKYNDKRVLAATYLDKLFELPSVDQSKPESLEIFIDKFSSIIAALKQLKIPALEDFLFIYLGCKKIGLETVKSFEMAHSDNLPTYKQFEDFVRNQSHILQRAHNVSNTKPAAQSRTKANNARPSSGSSYGSRSNNNVKTFVSVQGSTKCVVCGKVDHSSILKCAKFLSMSPRDRFKLLKANKMCVKCLSDKHTIVKCDSESRCDVCSRSHNTLLHFSENKPITAIVTEPVEQSVTNNESTSECGPGATVSLCAVGGCQAASAASNKPTLSVLLGTAQCNVVDGKGNISVLRAIVDSASQRDFITTECCKQLNLPIYPPPSSSVSGVGDVTNPVEGVTCLTIRSRLDDSVRFTIQPLIVNRITNELPTCRVDTSGLDYLNSIPLADSSYFIPGKIDLILGSDLFARILCPKTVSRSTKEPVAIETSLGYVIVGQAPVNQNASDTVHTYCTIDNTLDNCMNRFFELEEVPNMTDPLTSDERACEDYYSDTTRRDSNGRYIVSLPFKRNPTELGESLRSAELRYLSLERRLLKDFTVKEEYDNVFKEYLQKGYLRIVGEVSEELRRCDDQYVIPHHGVVRQDKSSTKLRVVLNASNPTTSGASLNDLLYTGVNLQNDLFKIILQFRLLPIALNADIRQMYLRILVREEDTRYQRLLYRFDCNEPIQVFEMTRVPFGLCCSPYLAIRTVRQLANDERSRFPLAAPVAERDIYMDDLATSCASVAQGVELSEQLINLFAAGGFELVKFSSNSPEVMAHIPADHRVSDTVEFSPENHLKILGLHWIPADDVFTFSVSSQQRECTKRNILSTIARLWDLMGFVAPVTLLAKLIMKSLWLDSIGWDEVPPQHIVTLWRQFESELPLLQTIKLPRHVGVTEKCEITVLGFADASENAYGGVVYIHVFFPATGQIIINLVCAKSRVAPSKTVITLARMELCANLILARLMRMVIDTYSTRCYINHVYAFTDSTVALAWIHSLPTRWQTFVANRVAKIQQLMNPALFHHIPGKDNPADCLSRGLTPAQLLEHPLWLHGPEFAQMPQNEWPVRQFCAETAEPAPEMKVKALATTDPPRSKPTPVFYELALRISSWPKLLRIVLYVLRFTKKIPQTFDVSHLKIAELAIIKDLQKVYFEQEISNASQGKPLSTSLAKLHAFLKDGVLRVGGRLSNADLDYDSQHPILLPKGDHVVGLIIDYYHRKNMHTGPELLMSLLRQKFWILSARRLVRKRVHSCNICFKTKPRNEFPTMADLPACRVQEAKAFCHCGIDYAGPLSIIPYRRRGVRSVKAYICLFICLVTKAVHIELSPDLSTEAFLNALKRFLSRRGPVSVIYSDCGTNFIGAKSHLDNLYQLINSQKYQDSFANELRDKEIQFKFNPPSAPHFGGIWESNIRSIKMHLSKVVGNHLLTYEEMLTALTQIEAVLNSRPLSVLSSDPSEPLALTPAHFLVLTPLKSLPSEDLTNENQNLINRKRIVDQLVQSFWKRWKVEYLNTLQNRNKWTRQTNSIRKGTVVLLKSENSAPLDWPLGVIQETFPGKDGVVRVVNVRTKTGLYRRPVVKVFPLPTQ